MSPCVSLLLLPSLAGVLGGHEVRLREVEGDLLCSVRAEDTPVRAVIADLAAQLGRDVVGFEELRDPPRVTVLLEDRPVPQVLRYVLGAAGLRARLSSSEIAIEPELPPFPRRDELREAAEAAYLAALVRFPDHPRGAEARLALGELEEERGRFARAARHYDHLAEDHPGSELVLEARWRAGLALSREQAFGDAKLRFAALANLRSPHAYHAGARLELARCLALLGDHRQALFVLDALERAYPEASPSTRAERELVRARAQVGIGAHAESLRALDHACLLQPELLVSLEAMELRALALERAGRPAEAAIAWIAFSQDTRARNARHALREAARLALEAEGQELAVVFVHGLAEERGFGDELLPDLAVARARLGLDAHGLGHATALERLQRGELLASEGLLDAACKMLEGAFARHAELDPWQRARLAGALASARVDRGDVDGALVVLRQIVPTLDSAELRRGLYVTAGELLEAAGRYDEAIDAYGGRL